MVTSKTRSRGAKRLTALAVAAVAVSAIAVAGCGGDASSTGSAPGDVAGFVPSTSPAYFEITTDLDGPQWTQVGKLAALFPGYPKLQKMIDDSLEGEDVNFETDVKPLLGERAAIAALSVPNVSGITTTDPEGAAGAAEDALSDTGVGVVDIAEGKDAAVTALITKKSAPQGEHDGVTYYKATEGGTLTAVTDGALVITDSQPALFAALDAHEAGGDQTLAGTSKFTDALGKLPDDVFAQGYLDVGSFLRQAIAQSPQLGQLGQFEAYQNAVVAASVAAEPDGVRVKGVVDGVEDLPTGGEFSPTLTSNAPADAIAYVGFSDVAGQLTKVFQSIQGGLGKEEREQIDDFSGQLPLLLGVSLDDLKALGSGEHALVVTDGRPNPGAALALKVDDGARAKTTLDTVREKLPTLIKTFSPDTSLPPWSQVPLANGVQGWRLPLSPQAGAVYGVDGDLAVIGTSVAAVTAVQSPTSPLAASAGFQAATDGMPGTVTSLVWVNLQQGIGALQRFGAFNDAPPETLANLRPLKSIAAWTTNGDTPTFEMLLTVK
jgi:Protein of unknown function (DUF3352)